MGKKLKGKYPRQKKEEEEKKKEEDDKQAAQKQPQVSERAAAPIYHLLTVSTEVSCTHLI